MPGTVLPDLANEPEHRPDDGLVADALAGPLGSDLSLGRYVRGVSIPVGAKTFHGAHRGAAVPTKESGHKLLAALMTMR